MAVRRLTIELDDVPDTDRRTSSPPTLLQKEEALPVRHSGTDIPTRQEDYQDTDVGRTPEAVVTKEVVGRTLADLVYAFMNRPEFMATVFVFLGFLVSVAKLEKPADLWIPCSIALALNVVWFGCRCIRRLIRLRTRG